MQTFDQHLLEHLQAGRITMEDAVRTASSPHDFKLMVAAQSRIGPRSHPNKGEGKIDGAPAQVAEPHPPSAPPGASQPPAAPPVAPPVAPPAAPPVATQSPVAPPGASAPPPGIPS
jgi:twitching motility protein PilT